MANLFKILTALAVSALLAAAPVLAQDSGTATDGEAPEAPAAEAPATGADPASPTTEGLSMGEAVADPNAPGTPYDQGEHGDWTIALHSRPGRQGPVRAVSAAERAEWRSPSPRSACSPCPKASRPPPVRPSSCRWKPC